MQCAGQRTVEEWSEASKMPPLAFILDRREAQGTQFQQIQTTKRFDSLSDVDAEHCPKGWTADDVLKAKRTLQHFREAR